MKNFELLKKDVENFFTENKELFYNERDFQVNLAFYLKQKGYDLFLEYSIPFKSQDLIHLYGEKRRLGEKGNKTSVGDTFLDIRVDIVVKIGEIFHPIELKFKTKTSEIDLERFGVKIEGKKLFKNQGAQNWGKIDFWRDVARIEFLQTHFEKVGQGLCIFMTNDTSYKGASKDNKGISNYTMKGERALPIDKTSTNPKYPSFSVRKAYEIHWKEKKDYNNFYYCILEV